MTSRAFATATSDHVPRPSRHGARPGLERLKAEREAFEAARRARGVPARGVLYHDEPDAQ